MSAEKQKYGVHSEAGKLRKVMVCSPGLAHQRLTPSNCDELLFDDVFAREEGDSIDPGELVPSMPRQDTVPLIRQVVAGVDAGCGESECLLALLFEEDDEEAVRTVIEGGVARSREQAREMLGRAKARAMAILAQ